MSRTKDRPRLSYRERKERKLGLRQMDIFDFIGDERLPVGILHPDRPRMSALPLSMITKDIVIRRIPGRHAGQTEVETNVPWTVVKHSPDGFEFGYGGSGPSDLALNILNLFLPPGFDGFPPVKCFPKHGKETYASQFASSLHHKFCTDFIGKIPQDTEGAFIAGAIIQQWINENMVVLFDVYNENTQAMGPDNLTLEQWQEARAKRNPPPTAGTAAEPKPAQAVSTLNNDGTPKPEKPKRTRKKKVKTEADAETAIEQAQEAALESLVDGE